VYNGNIENPVIVVASMDDPETETLEGYTIGNNMQIKFFDKESNNFSNATFIIIEGDEVFTPLGTSVGWIELPMTQVENITVNNEAVKIFPNPVQDKINILFEYFINTQVQVTMFTPSGEILYKNEFVPDNNSITIEFPGIFPGCYYLKLEFPDSKINAIFKKIVFINH